MKNIQGGELASSPYQIVASGFDLKPKLDLTLRLLASSRFSGSDCTQSLFIDSLLRANEFKSVVFSRSDFQGARIEACDFADCGFLHSDFRSTVFSGCRFERCDFSHAFFSDCEFFECELVECKIEQAVFTDCLLEKTKVRRVSFEKSSVVLDTFRQVEFDEVKLGDCTFLYNIVRECRFEGVSINAESVGQVFGLGREALSAMDFVYLGEMQGKAGADIAELLEYQYIDRKWETGLVILALNFGKLSAAVALPMIVEKIVMQARAGIVPKKDEVKFVERVLLELQREQSVPLLATSGIADAVVAYLDDATIDDRARQRHVPTMQSLLGTANAITLQILGELESLREQIEAEGEDQLKVLRITYELQPGLEVAELINRALAGGAHACSHPAHRIRAEKGSFIETIQTCTQGIFCLMAILYAVEGCIIRLTAIKARYQVLVQKSPPKQYRQLALSSKMGPQTGVVSEVSGLLRLLKQLEWVRSGDKAGLSKENITKIEQQD